MSKKYHKQYFVFTDTLVAMDFVMGTLNLNSVGNNQDKVRPLIVRDLDISLWESLFMYEQLEDQWLTVK